MDKWSYREFNTVTERGFYRHFTGRRVPSARRRKKMIKKYDSDYRSWFYSLAIQIVHIKLMYGDIMAEGYRTFVADIRKELKNDRRYREAPSQRSNNI